MRSTISVKPRMTADMGPWRVTTRSPATVHMSLGETCHNENDDRGGKTSSSGTSRKKSDSFQTKTYVLYVLYIRTKNKIKTQPHYVADGTPARQHVYFSLREKEEIPNINTIKQKNDNGNMNFLHTFGRSPTNGRGAT